MRAFLIDFENVKSAGLAGIENLTGDDKVIILYSANSNTISFEMHQKIISCQASVEYFQIRRGGKNSLDFQLSTLLGWMLANGCYSHLYIISNDSGFDALYDFWNSGYIPTECVVYRRATLAQADSHSRSYRRPAVPAGVEALAEAVQIPAESTVPLTAELTDDGLAEAAEDDLIHVIDLFQGPASSGKNRGEDRRPPLLTLQDEEEEEGLSLEAILATSPITSAPEPEERSSKEEIDPRVLRVADALPAALSEIVTAEHRIRIANDVVMSPGKQDFYRDIIRRYGQKKGLQVYKTVKSEYSSLKKLADA